MNSTPHFNANIEDTQQQNPSMGFYPVKASQTASRSPRRSLSISGHVRSARNTIMLKGSGHATGSSSSHTRHSEDATETDMTMTSTHFSSMHGDDVYDEDDDMAELVLREVSPPLFEHAGDGKHESDEEDQGSNSANFEYDAVPLADPLDLSAHTTRFERRNALASPSPSSPMAGFMASPPRRTNLTKKKFLNKNMMMSMMKKKKSSTTSTMISNKQRLSNQLKQTMMDNIPVPPFADHEEELEEVITDLTPAPQRQSSQEDNRRRGKPRFSKDMKTAMINFLPSPPIADSDDDEPEDKEEVEVSKDSPRVHFDDGVQAEAKVKQPKPLPQPIIKPALKKKKAAPKVVSCTNAHAMTAHILVESAQSDLRTSRIWLNSPYRLSTDVVDPETGRVVTLEDYHLANNDNHKTTHNQHSYQDVSNDDDNNDLKAGLRESPSSNRFRREDGGLNRRLVLLLALVCLGLNAGLLFVVDTVFGNKVTDISVVSSRTQGIADTPPDRVDIDPSASANPSTKTIPTAAAMVERQWMPYGQVLTGAADPGVGHAVSLSADGSTLALGALHATDPFGHMYDGSVQVVEFDEVEQSWTHKGQVLERDNEYGFHVALSADGNTMAASCLITENHRDATAVVRIFGFDHASETWEQLGHDQYTGSSSPDKIALSADGKTIAMVVNSDIEGENTVHVARFDQPTRDWQPVGQILGGLAGGISPVSVTLSANGDMVGIGGEYATDLNILGGIIHIIMRLDADKNTWEPVGEPIRGTSKYSGFGDSIAMSADGSIVIAGAAFHEKDNDEPSGIINTGEIRAYQLDSTKKSWHPMGQPLDGQRSSQRLGRTVAVSDDGLTLATTGAPSDNGDAGFVRTYSYNTTSGRWQPVGNDIVGEGTSGDEYGSAVALSGDGSLVVGASAGEVRAFRLAPS